MGQYDHRVAIIARNEDGTIDIVEIFPSQGKANEFLSQLPPLVASIFTTCSMSQLRVTMVS